MNENSYNQVMGEIKVRKSAVEKAVDGIYESNRVNLELKDKSKVRSVWGISAAAALLCLVMLAGMIFYPFLDKKEHAFVISVGAAELNTFDLVELGELKWESGSFGLGFDEESNVNSIILVEFLDFAINCNGKNIEKITYKINGKGFFYLPDSCVWAFEKQDFETEDENLFPYSSTEWSYLGRYSEKVVSFSANPRYQNNNLLLGLYTGDYGGEYCRMYDDFYGTEIEGNPKFDYQQMYYELFSSDEYSVDITATFTDGSTQTKTINLEIGIKTTLSESEEKKVCIISAVLAD